MTTDAPNRTKEKKGPFFFKMLARFDPGGGGGCGGAHMVMHMGICHLNGLLFYQISLDNRYRSHFGQKKSLEEGLILQKYRNEPFWHRNNP